MGLTRLLTWLLIIAGAWLLYKRVRRMLADASAQAPDERKQTAQVHMVRCARCGLHIPEHEAVHSQGAVYCCEEHRRLARGP